MDSTCRLCSQHSSSLTSIFNLKSGRLIADMISIICPIKIEVSDSLPHRICSKCLKIIIEAVELREKSVESDINFRSNSIQPLPETVVIKKEFDPFTSTIFFENESKNESGSESSEENGDDEEFFANFKYEPEIKKRKRTEYKSEYDCEHCGRKFTTQSHFTKHMR